MKIRVFLRVNARRIALGIIAFCLVMTGLSLRKTQHVLQTTDLIDEKNALIEVKNGELIEQCITITEKEGPIVSIGIRVATYQRELTDGQLTLKILNEHNEILSMKGFSADKIMDNEEVIIVLNPVLAVKDNKKMRIKLQVLAEGLKETDRLAIWSGDKTKQDRFSPQLVVHGEKKEDMVLSASITCLQKDRNIAMAYYYGIAVIIFAAIYPMLPKSGLDKRGEIN